MDHHENKEMQDIVQDACCAPQEDTPEEVHELKASLEACEAARNEWKDKFFHVSADLQNFKRRMEKEQLDWGRRAQADVVLHMLPIIDDFDRAMAELNKRERTLELDEWLKGFELITKSLHKFLEQMNVAEIKEMISFDPTLHEAIVQVPSEQHASGDIVDVIQKGYMLKEQVLRPAKVTVAK